MKLEIEYDLRAVIEVDLETGEYSYGVDLDGSPVESGLYVNKIPCRLYRDIENEIDEYVRDYLTGEKKYVKEGE